MSYDRNQRPGQGSRQVGFDLSFLDDGFRTNPEKNLRPELLDEKANKLGWHFARVARVSSGQFRRFHQEILKVEKASQGADYSQWAYLLVMLKSRAQYLNGRRAIPPDFMRFIEKGVNTVKTTAERGSPEDARQAVSDLRLTFEATLGYFVGSGGSRNQ